MTRRVTTLLAAVLVFAALVLPREIGQLTPLAFVRIPVEALVAVGVLLVLPARWRRPVALTGGALLGLLTVLKIVDMGFLAVLARPFDPVTDWTYFGDAASFLADSYGPVGAVGAAALALLAVVALVLGTTVAVARLSRVVVRRRTGATRALVVLTAGWLVCAALGAQLVAPVPVASRNAASLAVQKAEQVPVSLRDQAAFEDAFAAPDPFHDTPALLGGLRGKDVVLTFVESYGRSALEDPGLAPVVDPVLDDGTRRLAAAGYGSRSAFLTSSTAGGGSWLAHATLLSGLWVTNQQTHDQVVGSNRLTLTSAFKDAGWQTVAVMPGTSSDWPEARFFGIDEVRDSRTMGNAAKDFNRFQTPDQYTLAEFQRDERAKPGHGPLMAEIPLVTSHWPWAHIPKLVGWNAVGDGSVYDTMGGAGEPSDSVLADPARARAGYRDAIAYSLSSLISYVETYGDQNLVLIFLGDHQPSPIVTGSNASRDVPITVVARDPAVLARISGWGWQDGLKPGPQAPVWRMDAFRDRFLTAFAS
ncbi:sulfatase-like hydrolase/transferase [Pseudonocardia sp. 73-21]|uniref:sulfatase-like hydrolase/transferase n=1 Tax=Pseudonocardia sp. 73-21 TaxID=1895809 RepID=UPI00095D43C9|nr:sulfatase-like hydrolase/transferase [Pseudonocardia sp. 73-21]OJY43625.1 MAG: sulfatase [Pseudonocardia sp. 73-21]